VDAVVSGPLTLAIDHPAYRERIELAPATVAEVLSDLRG
jgi:hypothetical protein